MKVAEETKTTELPVVKPNNGDFVPSFDMPDPRTIEVPGWLQTTQKVTQGIGLCIGVILALPFIAISRGIEWYQSNKKKVEK
tara:strand:+ start:3953 stop:4198 length:246 start_codon:yes stop_codon:yes gene_type:complete